jgi:hypothetical protein
MSPIPAFPLQWPTGWKRTPSGERGYARFGKASRHSNHSGWTPGRNLTIAEGVERVRQQLSMMRVRDHDLVISTNLTLRLDGWPRSDQKEPADPGVAVYWRDGADMRCMAIDRYARVADNLAAIAATLDAMRAIERHGGAEILDRAFTGFAALPAPTSARSWRDVLDVPEGSGNRADQLARARMHYRASAAANHPDKGGDPAVMAEFNVAWEAAQRELQA